MKKTIALTLLSLASVFALSTTAIKAEENGETGETTEVQETEPTMETTSEVQIKGSELKFSGVSPILGFGELTIDGEGKARTSSAAGDLKLTVADLRGTRAGWHVTAKHGGIKYTGAGDKTDELSAATIELANGELTNTIEKENVPSIQKAITIGKNPKEVSNALSGTGMGTWSHEWKSEDISLIIPDKAAQDMYKGKYSTTITWTLAATPQAETAEQS